MTIHGHDVIHAFLIICAQTAGLAVSYFLTEWVKGSDEDEDLDNDER